MVIHEPQWNQNSQCIEMSYILNYKKKDLAGLRTFFGTKSLGCPTYMFDK